MHSKTCISNQYCFNWANTETLKMKMGYEKWKKKKVVFFSISFWSALSEHQEFFKLCCTDMFYCQ